MVERDIGASFPHGCVRLTVARSRSSTNAPGYSLAKGRRRGPLTITALTFKLLCWDAHVALFFFRATKQR